MVPVLLLLLAKVVAEGDAEAKALDVKVVLRSCDDVRRLDLPPLPPLIPLVLVVAAPTEEAAGVVVGAFGTPLSLLLPRRVRCVEADPAAAAAAAVAIAGVVVTEEAVAAADFSFLPDLVI